MARNPRLVLRKSLLLLNGVPLLPLLALAHILHLPFIHQYSLLKALGSNPQVLIHDHHFLLLSNECGPSILTHAYKRLHILSLNFEL